MLYIMIGECWHGNKLPLPLEAPDAVALSISIASLPLFSLMSVLAPYDAPC